MSTTTQTTPLMTAEEFLAKYGDTDGVELVRGRVVWLCPEGQADRIPATEGERMARFRHGIVCNTAARLLDDFVRSHQLGRIATNDTFIRVTVDTYRGADVLFVSYSRLPADQTPDDLPVTPELVVEVKSPSDRWNEIMLKAAEYLSAGVVSVLVLDPEMASATVYQTEELPQRFHNGDSLTLSDVLPGFAVPVARFFE